MQRCVKIENMENVKQAKNIALSFSTLLILLSANFFYVQGQSVSSNLEGTDWEVTVMDYYKPYSSIEGVIYRFGTQNKVKLCLAGTVMRDVRRNLNDQMDLVPMLAWDCTSVGTFKQTVNSVRIEFPNAHVIEATIEGNLLKGQITSRQTNETKNWAAQKMSDAGKNTETRVMSAKDLLTKADALMKQGKYREAIDNYTAALKFNLSDEEKLIAFGNCGNARVELKDYKEAKADYKQFFDIYFQRNKNDDPTLTGFESKPKVSKEIKEILINVKNGEGIIEYMIGDKIEACMWFNSSCSLANESNSGNKSGCENIKKYCNIK